MARIIVKAALLAAAAAALGASAAQAQPGKGPNGTWRCSAQGNIPIGILTVAGTGYKFQAVSNSLWALKPSDSTNGSGKLSVAGKALTISSGPLFTSSMKVRTGEFGQATSPYRPPYDFISLKNDPNMSYVLMCYRPGAGA